MRKGIVTALGLGLLVAGGGVFHAEPKGRTRTFLLVKSDGGQLHRNFEEECPDGVEMTVEEGYLATKTPAERERLLKPENAREYANGWKNDYITGPGGENVCNNPKSFLNDPRHQPYHGVKGKTSYGMNLDGTTDGRKTANTCAHPKFTGVDGEQAVDNQLYRAVGCKKQAGVGEAEAGNKYLIEIRGLDDPKNDDHVDVGFYGTDDVPIQGSDGRTLPNQTLGITKNPRWRATVAGRVVDGVLTTDTIPALYFRWVMPTWGALGQAYEYEFYHARYRMSLQPDGTLKGMMAAYRPIENIFTVGRCCKGTASTANTNCASDHKTLVMMADGDPDAETGKCTTISSAMNFTAIPVFIAATDQSRR